jgi:hypothetical protein
MVFSNGGDDQRGLRAGVADSIEKTEFTSVDERLQQLCGASSG